MESNVINLCAILGIGLFTGSFALIPVFREATKNYEREKNDEIFKSNILNDLKEMIAEENIDYERINSFYNDVVDTRLPKKNLRQAWIMCMVSGVCFILAAFLGLEILPSLYSYLSLGMILYGISFLLISGYHSIKLVNKLFR